MSLSTGDRLGPYAIEAPLGAGGMGEVYRATDTRLDRSVAVKVLTQQVAADPEARERFEREARAVAALSHPHICMLHDVGTQDGTDYLVMELLGGESAAARLERGALPLDEALSIGIAIADALDAAHRQGIVHRDLKPGNVMLTPDGVKLLDFGLAKLAAGGREPGADEAATRTAALTGEGTILGTLHYMSPSSSTESPPTVAPMSSPSAPRSTRWSPDAGLSRARDRRASSAPSSRINPRRLGPVNTIGRFVISLLDGAHRDAVRTLEPCLPRAWQCQHAQFAGGDPVRAGVQVARVAENWHTISPV